MPRPAAGISHPYMWIFGTLAVVKRHFQHGFWAPPRFLLRLTMAPTMMTGMQQAAL